MRNAQLAIVDLEELVSSLRNRLRRAHEELDSVERITDLALRAHNQSTHSNADAHAVLFRALNTIARVVG